MAVLINYVYSHGVSLVLKLSSKHNLGEQQEGEIEMEFGYPDLLFLSYLSNRTTVGAGGQNFITTP